MTAFIIVFFMTVSCAMSMPATKIYSIYLPVEENPGDAGTSGAVHLSTEAPRYLMQPYIVHRQSSYQLEMSRYAKWDAAPADIVNNAFRDAVSPLFGEVRVTRYRDRKSHSLDINLRRFERSDEGEISFGELVFDVSLSGPDGKELFSRTVSRKVRLGGGDNLSLARGLSEALSEVIGEVKEEIRKVL